MTPPIVSAGKVAATHAGDLAGGVAAAVGPEPTTTEEVVDVPGRHVGLELREGRRRVAAVEATDRHDRLLRGQLVARGVVGADGRCDPAIRRRIVLQERDELSARRTALEQPTCAAAPGTTTHPAEPAGAAGLPIRPALPSRSSRPAEAAAGAGRTALEAALRPGRTRSVAADRRPAHRGRPARPGRRTPPDRPSRSTRLRGRRGVERVRRGTGQRDDHCGPGCDSRDPGRCAPPSEQRDRCHEADHQNCRSEPRVPVRAAREQPPGPPRRHCDRHCEEDARHELRPAVPEPDRAHARRAPRPPARGRRCSTRGRCPA